MFNKNIRGLWIGVFTASLLLPLIAGCAAKRRVSMLPMRVTRYHEAYKNKDFYAASNYVENAEEFIRKTEAISENVEILDYEVLRISVNPEGLEATVDVSRSYNVLPSVIVEKQKLTQQWKYDSKRKNWFLVSPY